MEFINLSKKDVKKNCDKLYKLIIKDNYDYDLVIFIAKGSFYIGKDLAELKKVPLLEIEALRKGNNLKRFLRPMLVLLPDSIKKSLRKKELSFNKNVNPIEERYISFNDEIYEKYKKCKKILVVDDSIDTGNSVKQVIDALKKFFKKSTIKVAVFNVMAKSSIKADYTIYEDTLLSGPWSNDSKENKQMINDYLEWKNNYK